jgi:hypothetical protein
MQELCEENRGRYPVSDLCIHLFERTPLDLSKEQGGVPGFPSAKGTLVLGLRRDLACARELG